MLLLRLFLFASLLRWLSWCVNLCILLRLFVLCILIPLVSLLRWLSWFVNLCLLLRLFVFFIPLPLVSLQGRGYAECDSSDPHNIPSIYRVHLEFH